MERARVHAYMALVRTVALCETNHVVGYLHNYCCLVLQSKAGDYVIAIYDALTSSGVCRFKVEYINSETDSKHTRAQFCHNFIRVHAGNRV